MQSLLDRIHYPKPYLDIRDGVYVCRVYIPEALKTIYPKTTYHQRTLNVHDKTIAEKLLHRKANEIYDKFDADQLAHLEHQYAEQLRTQKTLDTYAQERIINFANAIHVPSVELVETTSLDELKAHRDALEVFATVLVNRLPDPTTLDGQTFYTELYSRDLGEWELPTKEKAGRMIKDGVSDSDMMSIGFNRGQIKTAIKYKASSVHTFWCDLFILAADKQKLKPPTLTTPENMWNKTYEEATEQVVNFYKSIGAEDLLD